MGESVVNSLSEKQRELLYFMVSNPAAYIELIPVPYSFWLVPYPVPKVKVSLRNFQALNLLGVFNNHIDSKSQRRWKLTDQARKDFDKMAQVYSALKLGGLNVGLKK